LTQQTADSSDEDNVFRFLWLGALSSLVETFSIFVRHFDILKMNLSTTTTKKKNEPMNQ